MKVQRRFKNMNIFGRGAGFSRPRWGMQMLVSLLGLALLFAVWPQSLLAASRRASPAAGRAGAAPAPPYAQQTSRTIAAVGSADCPVSGFAGVADPGGVDVSRASGRGRPMGAGASGFTRRGFGSSCGPTTLGPERQGAYRISIRPWKYGQEPFLDVIARRRLLQPATGCDGCRAGDAPAGRGSGQP